MSQDQPIETLVSEMKAKSLGERLWNAMSDPASTAWVSMDERERANFERIARAFTSELAADYSAPPFADNGIGGLMFKGGHAYLDEYVLSTEGDDHEPTEFERALLEDFMAGLLNDDAMFGPVRTLLASHAAQAEEIKALKESADEHALFDAEADQAFKDLDHQVSTLSTKLVEREQEVADLTKALTGLTCGGSEFFNRKGDRYVADIDACVAWVRRCKEDAHKRTLRAITATQEVQAKLVESEALEGALRDALERIEAATPGNTNSKYAEQAFSWTGAVASNALADNIAALTLKGRS